MTEISHELFKMKLLNAIIKNKNLIMTFDDTKGALLKDSLFKFYMWGWKLENFVCMHSYNWSS